MTSPMTLLATQKWSQQQIDLRTTHIPWVLYSALSDLMLSDDSKVWGMQIIMKPTIRSRLSLKGLAPGGWVGNPKPRGATNLALTLLLTALPFDTSNSWHILNIAELGKCTSKAHRILTIDYRDSYPKSDNQIVEGTPKLRFQPRPINIFIQLCGATVTFVLGWCIILGFSSKVANSSQQN